MWGKSHADTPRSAPDSDAISARETKPCGSFDVRLRKTAAAFYARLQSSVAL